MIVNRIRFAGVLDRQRAIFTRFNTTKREAYSELKELGVKALTFCGEDVKNTKPFAVDSIYDGRIIRSILFPAPGS